MDSVVFVSGLLLKSLIVFEDIPVLLYHGVRPTKWSYESYDELITRPITGKCYLPHWDTDILPVMLGEQLMPPSILSAGRVGLCFVYSLLVTAQHSITYKLRTNYSQISQKTLNAFRWTDSQCLQKCRFQILISSMSDFILICNLFNRRNPMFM